MKEQLGRDLNRRQLAILISEGKNMGTNNGKVSKIGIGVLGSRNKRMPILIEQRRAVEL